MRVDHRPQRDRDPGNPEAEQEYNRHDQEDAGRTAGEADAENSGDNGDNGHLDNALNRRGKHLTHGDGRPGNGRGKHLVEVAEMPVPDHAHPAENSPK